MYTTVRGRALLSNVTFANFPGVDACGRISTAIANNRGVQASAPITACYVAYLFVIRTVVDTAFRCSELRLIRDVQLPRLFSPTGSAPREEQPTSHRAPIAL